LGQQPAKKTPDIWIAVQNKNPLHDLLPLDEDLRTKAQRQEAGQETEGRINPNALNLKIVYKKKEWR
jgi:hypothetical protein